MSDDRPIDELSNEDLVTLHFQAAAYKMSRSWTASCARQEILRRLERIAALEAELDAALAAVARRDERWAALREQVDMTAPTIDRARLLTVMERLERETGAPTTCTPSNSYEPRPDWCGACPEAPCAKLEKYVDEGKTR